MTGVDATPVRRSGSATDPDRLYGEFHSVEDSLLQIVRAH
jgi:hypothetical protein